MSYIVKGRGNDLASIMEQMFGVPRILGGESVRGFPITDIKVHKENKNTVIDLFLAGFKKEDISIEVENGILVISGNSKKATAEESKYEYSIKQSSSRSFRRVFKLQEEIENISAEMVDGVLSITLVPVPPVVEKKLSKKIEIK